MDPEENWSDDESDAGNNADGNVDNYVEHKGNGNVIDKVEPKVGSDLVFLLYCAFIYAKRTRSGVAQVDRNLAELGEWLTQNQKLKLDVESCEASTLDFDDPDTPRVVDALNTYSPDFPLNLVFSDNSDSYVAKRINVRSPSLYTYRLRSGALDLPFLHGGKIEVYGDVSFDSVVDLLSNQRELALTTEIDVTGSLVGCSPESVELAIKHLCRVLCDNSDDELFVFSICGSVNFENVADAVVDSVRVRKWTISFSTSPPKPSRWCLKCSKST